MNETEHLKSNVATPSSNDSQGLCDWDIVVTTSTDRIMFPGTVDCVN